MLSEQTNYYALISTVLGRVNEALIMRVYIRLTLDYLFCNINICFSRNGRTKQLILLILLRIAAAERQKQKQCSHRSILCYGL